jgi:hypothetical protein
LARITKIDGGRQTKEEPALCGSCIDGLNDRGIVIFPAC